MDTQHIQHIHSKLPVAAPRTESVHTEDAARSFIAAFKQAIEVNTVPQNTKKEGQRDQKKRRQHTKEDYTFEDEIDQILAEIDERLDKLVKLAQTVDA